MVQCIRNGLIIPLRLAWFVMAAIPGIAVPIGLVKVLWRWGRREADAMRYVIHVSQTEGYNAALTLGREIFAELPLATVASFMGILSVYQNQIAEASQWLEKCKTARSTSHAMQSQYQCNLELLLSEYLDDVDPNEVALRISERRDVPMAMTRRALEMRIYSALRSKRWDDAQALLDRVFAIEDPSHARWMQWVAAAGMGLEERARHFFDTAWNQVPAPEGAILKTNGWLLLGNESEARAGLREAISLGAPADRIYSVCHEFSLKLDADLVAELEEGT